MNVLGKMIGFAVTTKPEEAKAFYGEKLGFQFVKDDGYALVFDANGTMLRVAKMQHFTAPQFTILGWEVSDISTMVRDLAAKGVQFERYDFMKPDEQGICTFPNGDSVAWFKDPDGNLLSVSRHTGS